MDLIDLDLVEGQEVYGGLGVIAHYGLLSDVDTWPAMAAPGVAVGSELVTISGDIVMKTGKRVYRLESTEEQTGFTSTKLGGIGNTAMETVFRFGHEGCPAVIAAAISKWLHNRKMFVIFKDETSTYLIGSPDYPARLTAYTEEGGTARGDAKMITGEISTRGPQKVYYTGVIPIVEAI